MRRTASILATLLSAACGGTTGSGLVSFRAMAGGPASATGGALSFDTGIGYHVTLTRARLRIGAVYLNVTVPSSGAAATGCVQIPPIYVAEAFGPVTVDLLSPILQPFPATGEATQTEAMTAEVWLTGGDVNAPQDPTVILDVAGTATKSGASFPFQGTVTISDNRAIPPGSPALPGSNPICKQRIVTPILVDITPTDGGVLTLRIDPSGMFNTVDFATLAPAPGSTALLQIPDTNAGAGAALFKGLLSNSGVYQFSWSG
jgi:hypothetical protein